MTEKIGILLLMHFICLKLFKISIKVCVVVNLIGKSN